MQASSSISPSRLGQPPRPTVRTDGSASMMRMPASIASSAGAPSDSMRAVVGTPSVPSLLVTRIISDNAFLSQLLDIRFAHTKHLGQQPFIVLAVAGRAAIDRTADIGGCARELHRQFIHRPGADFRAGDFGEPFQMPQLRIVIAAVFGILAHAGWDAGTL